jgi:hypothetical protein
MYYSKMSDDVGNVLYLVGSRSTTVPSSFKFGWATGIHGVRELNLKPQSFRGITDTWMSVNTLRNKLFTDLDKRPGLHKKFRDYLKSLFNHYTNGTEVVNTEESTAHANAIRKDFAEIIGPVWYINSHNMNNAKIYFPSDAKNPLTDSIIKVGDKEISISSKSGKVTNTIKGCDIYKVIELMSPVKKARIEKKYKKELSILNLISDGSMVSGPMNVFKYIQPTMHKEYCTELDSITSAKFKDMIDIPSDKKLFNAISALLPSVKSDATKNGIFFLVNKYIEQETKNLRFKDFMYEVLGNSVEFIVVQSIKGGIIQFVALNDDATLTTGAYIGYKDSIGRLKNRLGIQIEY